jgi:hypothetical protein
LRNPLSSEAEAYRLLGVVIVGAAVIIVASLINTWLGVAVAVVVFVALGWWLKHEPKPETADPPGRRRVLVVAPPGTTTVTVPIRVEVLVVVPATAPAAEETVAALESGLPHARVEVGAADPALAVEDALRAFDADEVLVLGDDAMVDAIRQRVALPVSRG